MATLNLNSGAMLSNLVGGNASTLYEFSKDYDSMYAEGHEGKHTTVIPGSQETYSDVPGEEYLGDTWRGLGSDWFNAENVAREDFYRNELAQDNQLRRDLYLTDFQNRFNAEEAQKTRDWEEEMSNTAYQRVVEDLKLAGLNPILAYDNGSANVPTTNPASGGYSRSSSKSPSHQDNDEKGIATLIAGIIKALV